MFRIYKACNSCKTFLPNHSGMRDAYRAMSVVAALGVFIFMLKVIESENPTPTVVDDVNYAIMPTKKRFMSHSDILAAEQQSDRPTIIPPGYDVLEIGASKGGSTGFLNGAIAAVLGDKSSHQTRTWGLDIDPYKVE